MIARVVSWSESILLCETAFLICLILAIFIYLFPAMISREAVDH